MSPSLENPIPTHPEVLADTLNITSSPMTTYVAWKSPLGVEKLPLHRAGEREREVGEWVGGYVCWGRKGGGGGGGGGGELGYISLDP